MEGRGCSDFSGRDCPGCLPGLHSGEATSCLPVNPGAPAHETKRRRTKRDDGARNENDGARNETTARETKVRFRSPPKVVEVYLKVARTSMREGRTRESYGFRLHNACFLAFRRGLRPPPEGLPTSRQAGPKKSGKGLLRNGLHRG